MWNKIKTKYVIVVAIILFIASCLAYLYDHTYGMKISEQGATGDAFNGFLSPFISLLSAILVYIAFKEQVKANELLSANTQLDTFNKLFNQIAQQVDGFKFRDIYLEHETTVLIRGSYEVNGAVYTKNFTGIDAINAYSAFINRQKIPLGWEQKKHMNSIVLIYEDFIILETYIQNAELSNKKYFYKKLKFYFELAFRPSIRNFIKKIEEDPANFNYPTFKYMQRLNHRLNSISSATGQTKPFN